MMYSRSARACLILWALLACAAVSSGSERIVAPVIPTPSRFLTVEERLDRIEQDIAAIHQLLGARSLKPIPGADNSQGPVSPQAVGLIPRLEKESQEIRRRMEATEAEIKKLRAPSPQAAAATGQLVIVNWTGTSQEVLVNGVSRRVSTGPTEIWVPWAILEVYVPKWEPPKLWGMSNWKWNGRHYEMVIEIRPR